MLRVWGFQEYSPSDQKLFDACQKIIQDTYQKYGYVHIMTPAVEQNKILTAKSGEETWKQIFGLYGLANWAQDAKEYSLHFDLTVPFARYILDWENELSFPFKKYMCQPVWRWERSQKGRFKEFVQADIDAIWRRSEKENYFYDSETALIVFNALKKVLKFLQVENKPTINLNSKKLMMGLKDYFQLDEKVFWLLDRYYKIDRADFETELKKLSKNDESFDQFLKIFDTKITLENIENILDFENENVKAWVNELKQIIFIAKNLSKGYGLDFDYKIDLSIIRWLDYYTGLVYELRLENVASSIWGWGRYDNLTANFESKKSFDWVWGSIGLSRLFDFVQKPKLENDDYLILNFDDDFETYAKIANQFQEKNISIYPAADKLKKQFEYANKGWYSKVIICWDWEKENWIYKLKDMLTWDEKEIKFEY